MCELMLVGPSKLYAVQVMSYKAFIVTGCALKHIIQKTRKR